MITIKGFRQGLLIVLSGPPDEPWLTRLRELENKLNANAGFFRGGQVAFDVKSMPLSDEDLRRAQALLHSHDVTLWAIVSLDEATQARVRALGLADRLSQPDPQIERTDASTSSDATEDGKTQSAAQPTPAEAATSTGAAQTAAQAAAQEEIHTEGSDGLLVRRRVRSGQVLRHPGHIVVLGDVNPGAQLIAGGDIIVWGKLHGAVHAGALGDDSAMVCALDMSPSFVKIADATRTLRPGERRSRNKSSKAEMALLKDQQIVFTPWERSA